MTQCMETWLLAYRQALRKFFGQGFADNALPATESVLETIAKGKNICVLGSGNAALQDKKTIQQRAAFFQATGRY